MRLPHGNFTHRYRQRPSRLTALGRALLTKQLRVPLHFG